MEIPEPPKDLEQKTVIDKLAQFVAKNGTDFECMTREKQRGNPKFEFLFGGNYQDYYQYKVSTLQKQFNTGLQNMMPQAGYHDHNVNQPMNEPPHSKASRWAPIPENPQIPHSSNGACGIPQERIGHISRWGPSPIPGNNNPDGSGMWPVPPMNQPPANVHPGWEQSPSSQQPYMRPDIPGNANWGSAMPPMSVNMQPSQSQLDLIKELCDLKSQLSQADHQLTLQETKMNSEIQESEKNLQAQYQTLMVQEPIKVEEALVQARQDEVQNLSQVLGIHMDEINSMIQPLIESCTKENISRAKNWVIEKTQTSMEVSQLIAKYLLSRSAARHVSFDLRLHIIYLINDLLHHCKRKGGVPPLLSALQEVVVPCFCLAIELSDDSKRQKLDKVLSLWESNSYLAAELLPQMRDPYKQLNIWITDEKKRHSDVIQNVSGNIQAQYIGMQHQHQEFANHQKAQTLGQKQLVEQLKQKIANLEQQQKQPPPPQNIPLSTPHPVWPNQPPTRPSRSGFSYAGPPGMPNDPISHMPPVSDPSVPPLQHFPPASAMPPGFPPPIQPNSGGGGSSTNIDSRPQLPDFSKPPPGFDPALLNGPPPGFAPKEEALPPETTKPTKRFDADLIPSLPYFELPAALMVPLIKLSDFEMKPIDPQDLRLPPPVPPSERLQNAVKNFYAPASHERPRDCDGWERLGLHEFYKAKEMAKRDPQCDRPTVSYDDLVQMAALIPTRGPPDFVHNRPMGGVPPGPGFAPRGMPPMRRDDQMMPGSNRWAPNNDWRQQGPPLNMQSGGSGFSDNRERNSRDRDGRKQVGRGNFTFGGFSRKRDSFRSRSRSRSRSASRSRSLSRSRSRTRSRSRSRTRSRSLSKSLSRSRSKSRSRSRGRSKTRSSSKSVSPPRFTSAGGNSSAVSRHDRQISEERIILGVNSQNDFDSQSSSSSFALSSSNKGHQMMQKMGWSGTKGLGLREQGRTDPISTENDIRDKSDLYRGVGSSSDEFDEFRKRKSQGFSAMMKTRSDLRAAAKEANIPPSDN